MKVLNAKEFGQVMWRAYMNDGMDPNTNGLGYNYDWSYNEQGNPVLNGISMKKYLDDAGTTPAADTDWFDEVTRKGVVQQYNVSVSKGSDKGSSFFSLGYYKNLGVIKESDFERFSARMNTEYKLLKNNSLTVGEHFTVNRTSEVAAPGGFLQNVLQFNPSLPIYTEDGNYAGPVGGYPDRYNPVAVLERNKDNRYTYWRMFGDAYINLNPFKGFNIRTTFGLDYSQKQQRFFTYPVTEGNVANNKNAVEAKQEHWTKWMWNAIATYNKEIGQHRFDLMAGMELNRQDDIYFSGYKEGFAVLKPDYMWPDAGTTGAQAYGGGSGYSLVSFFGKANYNYADKYMASFTIRRDGSSRFGKNNRYATFPSVSAGWRINQENFLKKASWIDDLKIRASWGQTGNQEIDNLARYTIFVSNYGVGENGGQSYGTSYDIAGTNGGSTLPSGFKRNQIGNDDIKWETTTITDFGFDLKVLRGLSVTFDWYSKVTKDILRSSQVSGLLGLSAPTVNNGTVKNTGIELAINYSDMVKKGALAGMQYTAGVYFDRSRNKLTKFGAEEIDGYSIRREGLPYNQYYMLECIGVFADQDEVNNSPKQYNDNTKPGDLKYKDISGPDGKPDGKIDDYDRRTFSGRFPGFEYGINASASWKGFDLSLIGQGVADKKFYTNEWGVYPFRQGSAPNRDYIKGMWTEENPYGATHPKLYWDNMGGSKNTRANSYFLKDASYFRLKNITFGYTLPKVWTNKLALSRVRVYFSGDNLLTITSYKGLDPERASDGRDAMYPQNKIYSFGINVEF